MSFFWYKRFTSLSAKNALSPSGSVMIKSKSKSNRKTHSDTHCCQSNLLSTTLLCHPLHAHVIAPRCRRVIVNALLPATARLCCSRHRLIVVFLSLPRIGDLRPCPTPPRCHSRNVSRGLQSCGRRDGYPCACQRHILTIPFARCACTTGATGWGGGRACMPSFGVNSIASAMIPECFLVMRGRASLDSM